MPGRSRARRSLLLASGVASDRSQAVGIVPDKAADRSLFKAGLLFRETVWSRAPSERYASDENLPHSPRVSRGISLGPRYEHVSIQSQITDRHSNGPNLDIVWCATVSTIGKCFDRGRAATSFDIQQSILSMLRDRGSYGRKDWVEDIG